jgi:hypothetical protein
MNRYAELDGEHSHLWHFRKSLNPKCDESGTGRDESGARGTNRADLGTNQRREVPLPDALARVSHALWAALRDSLGLIGPQRRLPAPLAAGMAHGIDEHRSVLRER